MRSLIYCVQHFFILFPKPSFPRMRECSSETLGPVQAKAGLVKSGMTKSVGRFLMHCTR